MSAPRSHSVQRGGPVSGRVAAAFGRVVSGRPIIRHLIPAGLLACALWWAPWPFGSVVPWAAAVVAALGALSLAAAFAFPSRAGRMRSIRPVAVPAAALVLLALLGALQAVPWPASLAGALSPEHVRLTRAADAALTAGVGGGSGSVADAVSSAVPLSLAPAVSVHTALLLASLAAALVAAAIAGRHRAGRRLLGGAVTTVALAQILYGAPRWLARSPTLWGVAIPGSERLRGTYVNPNHFALLLEIALAVAFAWGWWALRQARRELSVERRIGIVAPPVLVWLTLFVALAFSGSRAGLLATVAGLGVQAAALALSGVRRSRRAASGESGSDQPMFRRRLVRGLAGGAALLAVLVVGVGAVVATGGDAGFVRFTGGASNAEAAEVRVAVYRSTFALWSEFPWTGTGLGTFLESYPLADGPDLGLTWWHAHSDPLELLATTGVAGALLLLLGAVALVVRLVRRLVEVRHSEERAALVAGLGAFVAVGLHELVDFGLTMPANALALVVVLGAAAAAREPRHRPHREPDGAIAPVNSTGPGQTWPPVSVRNEIR